ncbi:MAG: hypothetical protein WCS51_04635 [Bacilli bacterium]
MKEEVPLEWDSSGEKNHHENKKVMRNSVAHNQNTHLHSTQ